MKARKLIPTIGAIFALVIPAAHAAGKANRLYQTRAQTILFEQTHQAGATKVARKGQVAETGPGRLYQTLMQTVLYEQSHPVA